MGTAKKTNYCGKKRVPVDKEIKALSRQIKQQAIELGADVVGIAPIERWETPPPFDTDKVRVYPQSGYKPTDLMPTARSVIVLGMGQLTSVIESNLSDAKTTYPYGNFGYVHPNRTLNAVCFELARWLEKRSCRTLPLGPIIGARFNNLL